MTILFANGDSFCQGVGASNPGVTDFLSLLVAAGGYALDNGSVSGSEAGDQAASIYTRTPDSSFVGLYFIGMNDQRHWGTNSVNLDVFKSTVRAEALWLAVNNADMVKSTDASVTYIGTWGTAPAYGSTPRYTDTMGDYADFSLTGNVLYITTLQQEGSTGQEQITIDGVDYGTYNVDPGSPITTALGVPYMPKGYRFDVGGAITDTHTVRITKANASALGSRVYFKSAWGNGLITARPKLFLAGPTQCTPAGYAATGIGSFASTKAYSDTMKAVAQEMSGDGLDVTLVDLFWTINPGSQTDTGGCHPNDGGHSAIFEEFYNAMAGI